MKKIKCLWNKQGKSDLKQTVERIAKRCSNCGRETMLYVDLLVTYYQEIITTFVLNTMLHHFGMIWIIENHEDLKYAMDIQNSDWMTGVSWYNKYICKKLHGKLFEEFIINARTDRYNIICSIDVYER